MLCLESHEEQTMPSAVADDAVIREQAYYFWEEAGRPDGRAAEFWLQAVAAATPAKSKAKAAAVKPVAAKAKAVKAVKPAAKGAKAKAK